MSVQGGGKPFNPAKLHVRGDNQPQASSEEPQVQKQKSSSSGIGRSVSVGGGSLKEDLLARISAHRPRFKGINLGQKVESLERAIEAKEVGDPALKELGKKLERLIYLANEVVGFKKEGVQQSPKNQDPLKASPAPEQDVLVNSSDSTLDVSAASISQDEASGIVDRFMDTGRTTPDEAKALIEGHKSNPESSKQLRQAFAARQKALGSEIYSQPQEAQDRAALFKQVSDFKVHETLEEFLPLEEEYFENCDSCMEICDELLAKHESGEIHLTLGEIKDVETFRESVRGAKIVDEALDLDKLNFEDPADLQEAMKDAANVLKGGDDSVLGVSNYVNNLAQIANTQPRVAEVVTRNFGAISGSLNFSNENQVTNLLGQPFQRPMRRMMGVQDIAKSLGKAEGQKEVATSAQELFEVLGEIVADCNTKKGELDKDGTLDNASAKKFANVWIGEAKRMTKKPVAQSSVSALQSDLDDLKDALYELGKVSQPSSGLVKKRKDLQKAADILEKRLEVKLLLDNGMSQLDQIESGREAQPEAERLMLHAPFRGIQQDARGLRKSLGKLKLSSSEKHAFEKGLKNIEKHAQSKMGKLPALNDSKQVKPFNQQAASARDVSWRNPLKPRGTGDGQDGFLLFSKVFSSAVDEALCLDNLTPAQKQALAEAKTLYSGALMWQEKIEVDVSNDDEARKALPFRETVKEMVEGSPPKVVGFKDIEADLTSIGPLGQCIKGILEGSLCAFNDSLQD